MSHFKTIAVVLGISSLVYILYSNYQPTYTYSLADTRLDAHQYAKSYDYFKGATPSYEVRFPFNTRILTPYFAAQLPYNIITSFKVINGIAIVLTICLLTLLWKKLKIRTSLIFFAIVFLLFHWKGPVRMYLPDPISADCLGYLFGAIWLLLLLEVDLPIPFRTTVFFIIGILATAQKESFIVVVVASALLIYFTKLHISYLKSYILYLIFSIFAYFLIAHFFPASNPDWRNNPIVSVLRGVRRYFLEPSLFFRLPISWLLTFGGFWLGAVMNNEKCSVKNNLSLITHSSTTPKKHRIVAPSMLIITYNSYLISIFFILLSVFAGGDTSRILMTAAPFIMTYLLINLNTKPAWIGYFAFVVSLPLMRLFRLEPDLGLYPTLSVEWCVECWSLSNSWPYWCYLLGIVILFYAIKQLKIFKFVEKFELL